MPEKLILASASPSRRQLLENAGVFFTWEGSPIDERAAEEPVVQAGGGGEEIAEVLAEAKALSVSEHRPGALVIGADQTLTLEGHRFHKPGSDEDARRQILALSGRTHRLASAVALVRDGRTVWRHLDTADITFRALEPPEIGRYLAKAGPAALSSVGAYQIEGPGLQLVERIRGDHWTIVGLPLLPLLLELRRLGALDG